MTASVALIVMVFELSTQKGTYRLSNRKKNTMMSIKNHQVLYGFEALVMEGSANGWWGR